MNANNIDALDIFILGEDIPTCPKCGSRTRFTESEVNGQYTQVHECIMVRACGFCFLMTEE